MFENPIHSQYGEIDFECICTFPSDSLKNELEDLSISLFKNKPDREYFSVLEHKLEPMILLARTVDKSLIAYKIGYQYAEDVFYSWIGGVHPLYRKHGIAQTLMNMQHEWCIKQNFRIIRTKSLFNNSIMYALNIKNGFSVIGNDYYGTHGPKLIFSKTLSSHHQI
jgi:GNAT superfamily N-acetyltransferase